MRTTFKFLVEFIVGAVSLISVISLAYGVGKAIMYLILDDSEIADKSRTIAFILLMIIGSFIMGHGIFMAIGK
jgi:hypothetical protein